MTEPSWQDGPLPEDEAIAAAHPLQTGRYDLYDQAMRLVGAKRSKGALVELVNWLLYRAVAAEQQARPASSGMADGRDDAPGIFITEAERRDLQENSDRLLALVCQLARQSGMDPRTHPAVARGEELLRRAETADSQQETDVNQERPA